VSEARPRVVYVCNAVGEDVRRDRGISTDSPAETAKVVRLVSALRATGVDAWVVSLGRGRQDGTWRWYGARTTRLDGVPVSYAAFFDAPVLTHAVTVLSAGLLALRLLRPAGAAVFYNPSPHYLGAVAAAALRGARRVLDLEDGARSDQPGARARIRSWLERGYLQVCRGGVIAANTALPRGACPLSRMVGYGVAPSVVTVRSWEPPLTFLLSGSLLEDTGTGLFLEALDVLERTRPDLVPRSRFVVTGFGDQAARLEEAQGAHPEGWLRFLGRVPGPEYERLLETCHCGLCLRLPERSMGATTFPSKVVEMAAYGLLVVSTRVSDVPLLFDDSSAELLPEASPAALASAFARIIEDPERARDNADRGLAIVRGRLSAEIVGRQLRAFLLPAKSDREPQATSRSADHL
jgi:glycosyltransferase involved in cell wall biosynthesis